jgi:hypothetical protein
VLLERQRGQLGEVVGADDQVDVLDPLEELLALLLSDTPRHGDHDVRPALLEGRELADLAPKLLLGLLADAARVEHDEVRGLELVGLRPAVAREDLLHPVGIMDVHLAAERLHPVRRCAVV